MPSQKSKRIFIQGKSTQMNIKDVYDILEVFKDNNLKDTSLETRVKIIRKIK